MAKELLPIVLSCAVWGPLLSCSNVEFKCDNRGVVDSINKGSSKEPLVMHLLCCPWYFSAYFSINISARHIPGLSNTSADQLSRNRLAEFLEMNPHTSTAPEATPLSLLKLLSPKSRTRLPPPFCTTSSIPSISYKHPLPRPVPLHRTL